MTLPTSGSLSYNTIRAEFGSPSTNVYLSLYYRGGPYTYPVPANASITTSSTGTISVANFYGADNTTDYAKMVGTTYNSGGKAPVIYYGTGAPGNGNGNFPDNTFRIGGLSVSIPAPADFWATNTTSLEAGPFSPTGHTNSNFTLRNFYFYNSSGTLVGQYRTGAQAGKSGPIPGWQAPDQNGVYRQSFDNALAGPGSNVGAASGSASPGLGPAAGWQSGNHTALSNNPLYIKAF